ncbi:MAG: YebC/PmpR family DNA-binding transcriptional regulator [Sedimentisphaerales bacterium]|nr:YebC/PmpR family DNA-binding transcriptional regulator [Sedimentisphaerales bacterium]
MSGHSHWAGIKHKKAAIDAKRGKLWSKLARNIIMAAKSGADPDMNLSLRYAIDKAKEANMPKDSIEKAVKKGSGNDDGTNYEEVLYEGYGANGVAVMCETLTDNRNRTASELRKIFDTKNGVLGVGGCVAWMFTKKGMFTVADKEVDEESLMELVLEAGADDFEHNEGIYEITCSVEAFQDVKNALTEKGIKTEVAELTQIPSNYVELDEEGARKVLALMEELEDQDDVQNVSANFDIPDEIMKKLSS